MALCLFQVPHNNVIDAFREDAKHAVRTCHENDNDFQETDK